MRPRLFIVSGPSGAGKGTLLADLRRRHPEIFYSVSATTRAPRQGEKDGVHYHFMTREDFERSISQNAFIEYKAYCGNFYGTPRRPVEEALRNGQSVVLEIETEGMRDAFSQYPDAVTVFIAPPSRELLAERLRGRKSEDEATVRKRLDKALKEMECQDRYQYVVVNGDLEQAQEELDRIYRMQTESADE